MNNSGTSGPQPTNGKDPASAAAGSPPQPPAEVKPAGGATSVSRAPLNLGGIGAPTAPASPPAATPAPVPPAAAPRPTVPTAAPTAAVPSPAPRPAAARPPAATAAGGDRISGCKTFFTKLHPGAIDFLDEQINQWLKENPSVTIKMTNTAVGEIQGKKTEANILMTVWYHGQAAKSTRHMG